MGGALIHGLISNKMISSKSLFAIDMIKDRCNYLHMKYEIECSTNMTSFIDGSDIIIIAVKPKDIENLAKNIKKLLTVKKLVITLAAGVSTQLRSHHWVHNRCRPRRVAGARAAWPGRSRRDGHRVRRH